MRRHAMSNGTAVATAVRASHRTARTRIRPAHPTINHRASVFAVGLAAAPKNIKRSRQDLARWLQPLALDPDQVDEILLAVSEAVTNAVEHGSDCDDSKCVSVQASVQDRTVTVSVKDSGRWISTHPDPATRTHRGRGLIMIREIADSVDIACTDYGTEIVMRFDMLGTAADQAAS